MSLAQKSFMQKAAMAVAPLALVFAAGTAQAQSLTPGKCYDRDAVDAVLAQEKQVVIGTGNRVADQLGSNIFTRNKSGSLGYNLEGNEPLGKRSTEMCARATYKDIVMNSPDNDQVPNWFPIAGAEKSYANGGRIVFAARSFTVASDGSQRLGKQVVINVVPAKNLASVWGVDSQGKTDVAFSMRNFNFTPDAAQFMTTPVAAAAPSDSPIVRTMAAAGGMDLIKK